MVILLVILGLGAASWWLIEKLSSASRIQDCVMAGHINCTDSDDAPMVK